MKAYTVDIPEALSNSIERISWSGYDKTRVGTRIGTMTIVFRAGRTMTDVTGRVWPTENAGETWNYTVTDYVASKMYKYATGKLTKTANNGESVTLFYITDVRAYIGASRPAVRIN